MRIGLLIIFIHVGQLSFGQSKSSKDLYQYVDSVVVHVLKSDTVQNSLIIAGQKKYGPLILVDLVETEKEKLKEINFDSIESIEIVQKPNQEMVAVFGQSAVNGIIVITTKKSSKKNKRKSKSD